MPTHHAARAQLNVFKWQPLPLPNSPLSLFLSTTGARLSLVHMEYLYSRWLRSRSLISKVTCRASVGGTGVLGLACNEVTWDILSPWCVYFVHLGKGLCFMVEYLPQAPNRRIYVLLQQVVVKQYIISQHQNQNLHLKIEAILFAHTSCTEEKKKNNSC